jgi:hypothetical protein
MWSNPRLRSSPVIPIPESSRDRLDLATMLRNDIRSGKLSYAAEQIAVGEIYRLERLVEAESVQSQLPTT